MQSPMKSPAQTIDSRPGFGPLVLVATLLTLAAPLLGQAPPAVEERAVAFVRSVATGDTDVAWAALEANFDPAFVAERGPDLRRSLGILTSDLKGAQPVDVLLDGERLTVVARGGGHAATFRFGWTPSPPFLLTGLEVRPGEPEPAGGPGPSLPPTLSATELTHELGSFLEGLEGDRALSGTVLVAHQGEAVYRGAFGLADRGWGVPNRIETRFDVGSIQKLFTKTALAMLVAEGRLSLNDTLAERLPGYPNREVAEKITLRQLAEHSSGLGEIFTDEFRAAAKTRFREPADFFPLFADEPLLFEPGTSRSYSNAGYQVLGAVLAAADGGSFRTTLARRVFEPAEMTATGFFARDEPTPDLAVGYTRQTEDGSLRNNLYRLPVIGSPAGSSFSTVDDLLRFERALRTGRLLPAPWAAWVLTGADPADPEAEVALASFAGGVAGGAPGVSAVLEISGPWTVIVVANQDPPTAPRTATVLLRSLEGTRIVPSS